jgi:ABC-type lipoprotein release transport system permease subunit
LIFGGGLALALTGALVGAALAVAGDAAIRSYLQGLARVDARVIGAIAALMTTMVVLAATVPALRALRVNPMIALRHE